MNNKIRLGDVVKIAPPYIAVIAKDFIPEINLKAGNFMVVGPDIIDKVPTLLDREVLAIDSMSNVKFSTLSVLVGKHI